MYSAFIRILRFIFYYLIISFVSYWIWSFAFMDMNPSNWGTDARVLIAFINFSIAFVIEIMEGP